MTENIQKIQNLQSLPKIYCINLKKSVDRRNRMETRLKNCNLFDKTTFITGVSRDSSLIDYYHQYAKPEYSNLTKWKSEMGCIASHLKAIRTFLEDEERPEECLICEDDIMFRNNFVEEYNKVRSNFLPDTSFVALSYMICSWNGFIWSGKDPTKKNICTVNEKEIWGLQLYWISREYAIEVLTKYDKPYINNGIYPHVSEVIVRDPRGFIAYPVLAIEECLDSERDPGDMPFHIDKFSKWGKENFTDYDNPL